MTNDEREIELIRADCVAARNDLEAYRFSYRTVQTAVDYELSALGQFRLLNHDYRGYRAKS